MKKQILCGVLIMLLSVDLAFGAEKLTILARGGSHEDVLKIAVEEFKKTHKDVEIKILGLENADLKQKISLDSQNKNGAYDIVMIDDPWMNEFVEGEILHNLSKDGYKADNDFLSKSMDIGRYPYAKGDIYALPFSGNVQFMFYNKSLLKELNSDVPTSWGSVLELSKKAKEAGKLGYVVRGQQGNPIVSDFLPLLWAFGGDVLNEENSKSLIDSKEALEALKFYIELSKTGENYEKSDIVSSVSSAKALFSLGWPSWYISSEGSKAEYGLIPSKVEENSKEYATGMIGNWMIGVTANSSNKELAMEFLILSTSKELQEKAVYKGGVPTRKSVTSNSKILKEFAYLKTLENATQNSVVRPRTPLWGEIEKALGIELSSALSGKISPQEALKNSQISIDKILSK